MITKYVVGGLKLGLFGNLGGARMVLEQFWIHFGTAVNGRFCYHLYV